MASKESVHGQSRGTCGHPSQESPWYHLRLWLSLEGDGTYVVTHVKVNGQRVRDFQAYHDFRRTRDQELRAGGVNELVLRWNWTPGEHYQVEVSGNGPKENGTFSFTVGVDSPSSGGYWDPAWKYYASLVLTEMAGVARENEPVHASLAVYADRVTDPTRELRVVAVDPDSGAHREVPCQVHDVARYTAEGMKHGDEYQPTTTFQFAFLADVPAHSSRVYLVFYGNPGARAPVYSSGLSVTGEGLGLTIENAFYRTILAPKSGAIDEIVVKMGVNQKIEHHLETNGALHWNPCFYCPPKPWLHASDWDPPPRSSGFGGPVFHTTTRSGYVDPYKDESHMAVTYRFYDNVPWIFLSTKLEVRRDVATKALRNGEFVVNRKLVEEFAWRKPDGTAGTMLITDGPRHPRHAKVLPAETGWAAFFSRKGRFGLGMVNIKLADFTAEGGLPKLCNRYSYLQWGKWAYYARPLVYTFASNNPARLVPVSAGNTYYEEMAVVPLRIDPEKEDFQQLELLHEKLRHPLDVLLVEDTDPRAPEGWVPPVLVKEFEEMDDE